MTCLTHRSFAGLAVATALLITTAPLLAISENGQLFTTQFNSTEVTWQAQRSFGGGELVISAPGGQIFRHQFGPGETPVFSVLDTPGFELVDGNYGWELHLAPTGRPLSRDINDSFEPVVDGKRDLASHVVSGNFGILDGQLVLQLASDSEAEGSDQESGILAAPKDNVILDDLIVDGSTCIGLSCANGENFGFDTLRLKENNLRIKFQDTSGTSYPTSDWQLTANDSFAGGLNKFSIEDIDAGRSPLTIEAGAPSHSLYVDGGGLVGLGTSIPEVDLHVVSGNTPALRLEQNGTSAFTPQTWDVAGNEFNFLVRDVTNSSALPFRIRPGAPTDTIFVDTDGEIGLGTAFPDAGLHLRYTSNDDGIHVETTAAGTTKLLALESAARPRFEMRNNSVVNGIWNFDVLNDGNFAVIKFMGETFTFQADGDLSIVGDFISSGIALDVPDYVFEDGYELMSLDQLATFIAAKSHLPGVPSAGQINSGTLNMTQMQMKLLEKVEELTLYTLQQQTTIEEMKAELAQLRLARDEE